MKYSVKKFTAWVLTFMMLFSTMPIDSLAAIITVRQTNEIIDISDSVQIAEDLVTSRVTSKDGYTVVVTSMDEILPEKGEVFFLPASDNREVAVCDTPEHKITFVFEDNALCAVYMA